MSRKAKTTKEEVKETPVAEKLTTRKKVKTLIDRQVDGKLHNKRGVKSIDELLGEEDVTFRDYKTEEQYQAYLDGLNQTDLETHASSLSILPREDRVSMEKQLLKEYRLRKSDLFNTLEHSFEFPKPISDEVQRILSEGR